MENTMTGQVEKRTIEELAIFGGRPAFSEPLHVGRPNIGDREMFLNHVEDILDRRWLTNDGRYVQEFEHRVADLVGAKHCVTTCNATVALEIAIRAVGLSGEVIVPAFTFIATAHALQWQEITPVFCDIDPYTHNIDANRVMRLVTPRTSGIIGVHLWGRPCDVEALEDLAQDLGLTLLFDAAHAFGCSYKKRMIGTFGSAEVFSFHATKFLNTFEGGAVVTNDDELARKLRLMKNFGFSWYDEVVYLGTNGKMSEVSAAMGLAGLESMDEFIATNRQNHMHYKRELADIPGVSIITYDEINRCNYQYVILEIDEALTGISRDLLMVILHHENVFARRYFFPGCHRMEPYRSYFPNAGVLLPHTEQLVKRVLCLPTGTAVGERQIRVVCDLLRLAIENSAAVLAERSRYSSEHWVQQVPPGIALGSYQKQLGLGSKSEKRAQSTKSTAQQSRGVPHA
jgi:dTDP-4-amino-4,6-dideoxygalactose transaminase